MATDQPAEEDGNAVDDDRAVDTPEGGPAAKFKEGVQSGWT